MGIANPSPASSIQYDRERTSRSRSLYEWAARRGVDLDDRITSGYGLTRIETHLLFENLRYFREFGRKVAERNLKKVSDVRLVAHKTHNTRVSVASAFLIWGLERTIYSLDIRDSSVPEIRERCLLIRRTASQYSGGAVRGEEQRVGLSLSQRFRLLQVIDPKFSGNPFTRPVRFRNYVLILLLLLFGFRRGEELKLYVSDLTLSGRNPTLQIVRRPGDVNDTRAIEPSVKTAGRKIPLSRDLTDLLSIYVQYHRDRFLNSDKSPFLFFSGRGKPLALRSVNAAFEQIRRRYPEFNGLTPHVLRYTYNDMLTEARAEASMSDEEFRQAQSYLNGWSLNSHEGDRYSRGATIERAQCLLMKNQRDLFAGISP